MADPTKFVPGYDYTSWQASNPTKPLPGNKVDQDMANIATSIDEAVEAIKNVRRSDGALKNEIVTLDSLAPEVLAGVGAGALASAEAAAASADAASDSAVAAVASATAADGSATAASGYASTALTYRNAADGFADDSAAAATLSQTARDLAAQWASAASGVDVNDGVNPVGKSAYHWAQVALDAAAGSVADGSITTAKLANGALSADADGRAKMADGFVTSAKIADGTIATAKILNANVTTAKLADSVLSADTTGRAKMADGFLTAVKAAADFAYGQCRLAISGGNLLLSRYNGRLLTINGRHCSIPSAGVSLAPTGATPSTTYYIYANDDNLDGIVDGLEYSTTGHATDGTTGVEIKSGDATRTLVGMARPITGPAWADSVTQRFVRSWFNRKREAMRRAFTAVRTTTSTSFTEVNTEIRCEWLQWIDETPIAHIQGSAQNSTATAATNTAIGWDGVADANTANSVMSATELIYNCSTSAPKEGLAEGYHYATLMGCVSAASTGRWAVVSPISYTSLSVSIS